MSKGKGYQALWGWFGLSRASWLTLPRALCHEMPDEWQAKLADLLKEWDATWSDDCNPIASTTVSRRQGNKFAKFPEWITNYRYPDFEAIEAAKIPKTTEIELKVGDPRRAAWLQHMRNTGQADQAQAIERARWPLFVTSDWPPESPEVHRVLGNAGKWVIPPGTPEWASHVCAMSAGRRGAERAMDHKLNPRDLFELERWATVKQPGENR